MDDHLRARLAHHTGNAIRIADIERVLGNDIAKPGKRIEGWGGGRLECKARDGGPHLEEPQTHPRSLEPRVACEQHAAAAPEGGVYSHVTHGRSPLSQAA